MKIRFVTDKTSVQAISRRLEQPLRAGDFNPPVIRDSKVNAQLAVFEMENRYEALQPAFERQLKDWEYKQEIAKLKIEK